MGATTTHTTGRITHKHERIRRHERLVCSEKLQAIWSSPAGETHNVPIDALNTSYEGLQVASQEPLPVHTFVQIRGETENAFAWVHYSEAKGGCFLAGLKLLAGT